jgi:outer membrane protein
MYGRYAAALLAGFAAVAVAQPLAAVELTLGLGAAYAPDYEGSDDYEAAPLWNIKAADLYHPETYFQIAGLGFSSNLLPNPHFRLGLTGAYRADYDNVDDSAVQNLKGTEDAFLIGPTLGYDFLAEPQRDAALEVDVLYDAAHGNGGVVTPRFRAGMPVGDKLKAEGRVSATWASGDYMGNWFSVNQRDATRSGLDTYDADEGFKDLTLGGSLTWAFLGSWSLTGLASYSRMLGDAEDSPVVDEAGDANQLRAGLLVNYTF